MLEEHMPSSCACCKFTMLKTPARTTPVFTSRPYVGRSARSIATSNRRLYGRHGPIDVGGSGTSGERRSPQAGWF